MKQALAKANSTSKKSYNKKWKNYQIWSYLLTRSSDRVGQTWNYVALDMENNLSKLHHLHNSTFCDTCI